MNTNDQWFSPGDKVCRVQHERHPTCDCSFAHLTPVGKVFCVSGTYLRGTANFIMVCGIDDVGFLARNFRRVDEIKLCATAAKHIKQREEELV